MSDHPHAQDYLGAGADDSEEAPSALRDSLSNQTYWRLRKALKQSHFRPGQRLFLRTIAAELGVSLTPLREAFARLVSENALAVDARGVVSVPVLTANERREIRDLRVELEGRAAHHATAHVSDSGIAELRELNKKFYAATVDGDWITAHEANEKFHFQIYELARMPILFSLIEGLWMRTGPFLADFGAKKRPPFRRHGAILKGLELRDPELVRYGIEEDIMMGWINRRPERKP